MAAFTKTPLITDIAQPTNAKCRTHHSCNRSHNKPQKNVFQHAWMYLLLAFLFSCSATNLPLVAARADLTRNPEATEAQTQTNRTPLNGTWANTTNGSTVGFNIIDHLECEMFLERPLNKRVITYCQYKKIDKNYFVYLKNNHGECDDQADFMFTHSESSNSLSLLINETPIELHFIVTTDTTSQ